LTPIILPWLIRDAAYAADRSTKEGEKKRPGLGGPTPYAMERAPRALPRPYLRLAWWRNNQLNSLRGSRLIFDVAEIIGRIPEWKSEEAGRTAILAIVKSESAAMAKRAGISIAIARAITILLMLMSFSFLTIKVFIKQERCQGSGNAYKILI